MKKLLLLAVLGPLIIGLPGRCSAQTMNDNYYWLGIPSSQPIQYSPKYHIQYLSNGYEVVGPKRLAKGLNRLNNAGAPERAKEVLAALCDHWDIGTSIDQAWEAAKNSYRPCFGNEVDQKNLPLVIVIQPESWVLPQAGSTITGSTWEVGGERAQGTIWVDVFHYSSSGFLQYAFDPRDESGAGSLLVWECQNWLGYELTGTDEEHHGCGS